MSWQENANRKKRERYAADPAYSERMKARARKWRQQNLTRASENDKRKAAARPEVNRAATARWRAKNKDRMATMRQAWFKANPRARAAYAASRRARIRGSFVEHIDHQRLHEMHGGRCGVCGEFIDLTFAWPHPRSLTHDHVIPVSRGGEHSYANAQPAHWRCNELKGAQL